MTRTVVGSTVPMPDVATGNVAVTRKTIVRYSLFVLEYHRQSGPFGSESPKSADTSNSLQFFAIFIHSLSPSRHICEPALQGGVGGQHMLYPREKRRSFGIDDRPTCRNCRKSMSLTRRGPDAAYGSHHERQIFACRFCGLQTERTVGADGNPPECADETTAS
jgi:hypothetical protein